MSSAKSPALTQPDLHDALQTALVEVSENAFFVFVETCDAGRFAKLIEQSALPPASPAGSSRAWLKASVSFAGAFPGTVEIALPERLGASLVASLLGMQPDETLAEAQMFDGVGEFANMVCGAWLSRLGDKSLFELRIPAVTRMAPEWNPVAEAAGRAELVCQLASVNELPVRVRVYAQ